MTRERYSKKEVGRIELIKNEDISSTANPKLLRRIKKALEAYSASEGKDCAVLIWQDRACVYPTGIAEEIIEKSRRRSVFPDGIYDVPYLKKEITFLESEGADIIANATENDREAIKKLLSHEMDAAAASGREVFPGTVSLKYEIDYRQVQSAADELDKENPMVEGDARLSAEAA